MVVSLSLPLLFGFLGNRTVCNVGEARFAQAAKEMIESGDYLVPRNLGRPLADYPPLMYWLIVLASALLGGISEYSCRFPSALAGLGVVLVTYRMGRTLGTPWTGLAAALVLMMTPGFVQGARDCRPDMVMNFFIVLALWVFLNSRAWAAFYVALGFGVLAKGPQAVILTGGIIFFFLLWKRDLRALGKLRLHWGALIVVGMFAPWLVLVGMRGGGEFLEVFLHRNLDMFFGGKLLAHYEGPFFYVTNLFGMTLPWIFFFPAGIASLRRAQSEKGALFWIWPAFMFLFYAAAAGKRYYYLIQLLPAFCLIAACYWGGGIRWTRRVAIASFGPLLFVLLGALAFAAVAPDSIPEKVAPYATLISILGIAWVVAVALAAWFADRGQEQRSLGMLAGVAAATLVAYMAFVEPGFDARGRDVMAFCRRISQRLEPSDRLSVAATVHPYIAFYLGRPYDVFEDKSPARGPNRYFIVNQGEFDPTRLTVLDESALERRKIYLCKER
jgi:4-amino-4-deoxy-L-arabinose transferase-like glycosyltransferase